MRQTFDIVSPTKQNVRGQVILSPGIDAHGLRARPGSSWVLGFLNVRIQLLVKDFVKG